MNSVDSNLNTNSRECKHGEIVQQFESTEQAAVWINAVRQATVGQLVTLQQQQQSYDFTNSFDGHWQAAQGPCWPCNSSQINTVDQGDSTHQEAHSLDALQDKDGNTTNGNTTEVGKQEETIAVDAKAPLACSGCTSAAPPAPADQQSPHFLRTTFIDSDLGEIEGKWARPFAATIK